MKQILNKYTLCFALAFSLLATQGCSTTQSPETIAYKTVSTVTTTVDSSRKVWNQYVLEGHATAQQVQTVADAYSKYQKAVAVAQVAQASFKANQDANALNQAMAIFSDTSAQLLALIQTFVTIK